MTTFEVTQEQLARMGVGICSYIKHEAEQNAYVITGADGTPLYLCDTYEAAYNAANFSLNLPTLTVH